MFDAGIAKISLSRGGESLLVEEDGFVPGVVDIGTVTITATIMKKPETIAITPCLVIGQELKRRTADEHGAVKLGVYVKQADTSKALHTERKQNHLNVLELVSTPHMGISLRFWEISLVSQYGQFFLVSELRDEAELGLDEEGRLVFSEGYMAKDHPFWMSFRNLVAELIVEAKIQLPPAVADWFEKKAVSATGLPAPFNGCPGIGVCISFLASQGTGMVLTPDHGLVAVHYTAIRVSGRKLASLEKGMLVWYSGVADKVNTWEHKSQFRLQAFGVHPFMMEK